MVKPSWSSIPREIKFIWSSGTCLILEIIFVEPSPKLIFTIPIQPPCKPCCFSLELSHHQFCCRHQTILDWVSCGNSFITTWFLSYIKHITTFIAINNYNTIIIIVFSMILLLTFRVIFTKMIFLMIVWWDNRMLSLSLKNWYINEINKKSN